MDNLPELTDDDYVILADLIRQYPSEFYINRTVFFIKEMKRYIEQGRVWRISIMGETRGGKSETASTICFLYKKFYNNALKKGCFSEVVVNNDFHLKDIDFEVKNVMSSQSNHIDNLRTVNETEKLTFGQIWLIDEDRKKIGGLGSMSEDFELKNINNISAKFMQSEIWIKPDAMLTKNTPYGLVVYQKDVINKVNWCLLYKISMTTGGTSDFKFLGWVCIPLHHNEVFREEYEEKKNRWIAEEFEGSIDNRLKKRHAVAEQIKNNPVFECVNGRFSYSKDEQFAYINKLILDKEIQNFNEREKYDILSDIRLMKKTA